MPTELPLPRIIVSGDDARGRSRIIGDGPPANVRSVEERPGYRVSNVWLAAESPVAIADPDRSAEIRALLPPAGGNILRVIDYPPEPADPVARQKMFDALFKKLFPDGDHRPDGPHPGMHTTDTVDYAIVLAGEIHAVMDDGEVLMRAGDILIQRGTNHAWSNRSGGYARIAFVLIDGKRDAPR